MATFQIWGGFTRCIEACRSGVPVGCTPILQSAEFGHGEKASVLIDSEPLNKDNVPINIDEVRYDLSANGYRLPTEAEWECAARAFQSFQFSGSEDVDLVAWTVHNTDDVFPRVGMKEPNALGLYDMSGLIWEWCWDWYDAEFYASSPSTDPIASTDAGDRGRGGSRTGDAINSRVSLRGRADAFETWDTLGFRIVCRD